MNNQCIIFWFRRDLRLYDNLALHEALKESSGDYPLLPIFIFDPQILDEFPKGPDRRVSFIVKAVSNLKKQLRTSGSDIRLFFQPVDEVFEILTNEYTVKSVFCSDDYEPSALKRDNEVRSFLSEKGIPFISMRDQTIFAKDDILKSDKTPYTVFTPYKRRWYELVKPYSFKQSPDASGHPHFMNASFDAFFNEASLGFEKTPCPEPFFTPDIETIRNYEHKRDTPSIDTTLAGIHLRFGTTSIRELADIGLNNSQTWLDQLIWRDFFMQILYHFPKAEKESFKKKYELIRWNDDIEGFEKWKEGRTGVPIVDAGMRQLNATGFMHNRVRMIVASFLVKDLLIDWRWGERYFAEKLDDYDLASNNGNWQWAAGTGCDAAPYFRVFNPFTQQKKFDPHNTYINRWIPEIGTPDYPDAMVDHKMARERALARYRDGIQAFLSQK